MSILNPASRAKWSRLAVTGLVLFSLAACGNNTTADGSSSDSSSPSGDPIAQALALNALAVKGQSANFMGSSGKTLGVMVPWFNNDGFQAFYVGIVSKAIENQISVVTVDAQQDPAKGLAAIEDLISKKVDAIVMDPFDAAALSAAVKKANAAGIPVVAYDQPPTSGEIVAVVASDNVSIGSKGADLMAEAATAAGLDPAKLVIAELLGDQASQSGVDRKSGFEARAAELGMKITVSPPTNWDDSEANAAVLDAFQANPNIDAIYMPSGCAVYGGTKSALQSLGKWVKRGEAGHILLISTDGCPAPIQGIRDGYVDADSAQQLLVIGQTAADIATKAANGETPKESKVLVGPDAITPKNVDSNKHWANVLSGK